jgi:hypothetical protein
MIDHPWYFLFRKTIISDIKAIYFCFFITFATNARIHEIQSS